MGELSTCSIICLGVIPSKRCGVGDMVGWLWTATGQPAPVIVLMIVLMLTTRCGGIVHMFHYLPWCDSLQEVWGGGHGWLVVDHHRSASSCDSTNDSTNANHKNMHTN